MAWEPLSKYHERNANGYTLTRNVIGDDGTERGIVQWGAWPPESQRISRREYAGPIGFYPDRAGAIAACRAHFERAQK